jgi:hypothetical protein
MRKLFSLGLIRGLLWQAAGMIVGGFLVTGIRYAWDWNLGAVY